MDSPESLRFAGVGTFAALNTKCSNGAYPCSIFRRYTSIKSCAGQTVSRSHLERLPLVDLFDRVLDSTLK